MNTNSSKKVVKSYKVQALGNYMVKYDVGKFLNDFRSENHLKIEKVRNMI